MNVRRGCEDERRGSSGGRDGAGRRRQTHLRKQRLRRIDVDHVRPELRDHLVERLAGRKRRAEELIREVDVIGRQQLLQRDAHDLLARVRGEYATRSVDALHQRDPVLHVGRSHCVHGVLSLEPQVTFKSEDDLAVTQSGNRTQLFDVADQKPVLRSGLCEARAQGRSPARSPARSH